MKRYRYKMHHQWLSAPNIGVLDPIFIQEVTPGDTWQGHSTAIHRMAPMNAPAYMNLKIHTGFFFVPHSMTFPEFPDVITGNDTSTAWPTITYAPASFSDWYRFGVGLASLTPNLNALPVRAFNKVWNEYFRNPLTTSERSLDAISVARVNFPSSSWHGGLTDEIQQGSEETIPVQSGTPDYVKTTDVRDYMNRQRMRERRAQYGDKYQDLLRSYGVQPDNLSLDKPELVAKSTCTMGISEVVATATSTSEETGEYRGHGIIGKRIPFRKRMFKEHGTLIGVQWSRPRMLIQHKHDHMWNIGDKDDLYHPELANDTQVEVTNREVYSSASSEATFAYQARDEWLRSPVDTVSGGMLSSTKEEFYAKIDMSGGLPTMAFLQQVQDYDHLFQDQTASRADIRSLYDHKISKTSIIRPRKK
jgi:hypothetical protein